MTVMEMQEAGMIDKKTGVLKQPVFKAQILQHLLPIALGILISTAMPLAALAREAASAPKNKGVSKQLQEKLWKCWSGYTPGCYSTHFKTLQTFEGLFKGYANLDKSGKRFEEAEKNRRRVFTISVPDAIRVRIDRITDKNYVQADWPKDISPQNTIYTYAIVKLGGKEVRYDKDVFDAPAGSTVKLVVEQDTYDPGYRTYYPAKWKVVLKYKQKKKPKLIFRDEDEQQLYKYKIIVTKSGMKYKIRAMEGDVRLVRDKNGLLTLITGKNGRCILCEMDRTSLGGCSWILRMGNSTVFNVPSGKRKVYELPDDAGGHPIYNYNGVAYTDDFHYLPDYSKEDFEKMRRKGGVLRKGKLFLESKKKKNFRQLMEKLKAADPDAPHGRYYETPLAVAGVRATKFELEVEDTGFTRIHTIHGEAWCQRKLKNGRLEKKETIIQVGEYAEIRPLPKTGVGQNLLPLKISTWRGGGGREWWEWRNFDGSEWKPDFNSEPDGGNSDIAFKPFMPPHLASPAKPGQASGSAAVPAPAITPPPTAAAMPPRQEPECGAEAECKEPPEPVRIKPEPSDAKPEPAPAAPLAAQTPAANSALDLAFWNSVRDSANAALFRAYLDKFPQGVFAVIAREKLKSLKTGTPNAAAASMKTPKAQSAITPPAAKARSLVLSSDRVGGITADTPFTLAAIQAALPGFSVKKGAIQYEEVTSSAFYVKLNGKLVMVVEGGENNQISSIKIYHPLVAGPSGLHVGDSIAKVRTKVALGQCYWGGEEMEGKITCFPPQGPINYIFTPPDTMNPEDNNDLTPGTIPAATLLTRFDWNAPEREAPQPVATKPRPPAPAMPPSPAAMSVQQLLQQGDALAQRHEAAKALAFYLEAARKGSAMAYYNIGRLYETGNGVLKTRKGAMAYYDRAAALGYLPAYSRMIVLQGQNKNFNGAAQSFFKFYRANPAMAMQAHKNWSGDILRTIQIVMKNSGHYQGAIDGRFGPETRAAIAAYASGRPPVAVPSLAKPAASALRPGNLDSLAARLQRQLRRVGCYQGPIDGEWGRGSSRALRNYNHWAGDELPTGHPSAQALRVLSGERGAVCGLD